jgi:hypothetical protein
MVRGNHFKPIPAQPTRESQALRNINEYRRRFGAVPAKETVRPVTRKTPHAAGILPARRAALAEARIRAAEQQEKQPPKFFDGVLQYLGE